MFEESPFTSSVPTERIEVVNPSPLRKGGEVVLYWMTASRRTVWNHALQRAMEWARYLRKPLVILEALRCDYPWASDRLHQFILEGMYDNFKQLRSAPVVYYPFVERGRGDGKGLLKALSEHCCVVVTDGYPCFFLPHMLQSAASRLNVRMEQVDSNGLLPLRSTNQVMQTAYSFRRFLQTELPKHLDQFPAPDPFHEVELPHDPGVLDSIRLKWPPAEEHVLRGGPSVLGALPIDHTVSPAPVRGGSAEAADCLTSFFRYRLSQYPENRNHPDEDGASGLSPYLHFGHISVHEVVSLIFRMEDWSPRRLGTKTNGRRTGWWGLSEAAEAFLDELITWRELGFNFCSLRRDYDKFESLPDWARHELELHAHDPRPYIYTLEELENSSTHDALWNAAQRQLAQEGRMHNYLRMLWGKNILQWTESPREALKVMIHLNNKYALDGRDPNSYTGIMWVLGRYDRAWGPVRPVLGKIRYMSSTNTARKLKVLEYLEKYRNERGA